MDVVAKRYQDQITRIKKTVKNSYDYFKPNYDRFNEYRRFVFESSLTPEDITLLMTLGRPQLEFNVLEAYISRLLGEFSKQEPDISITADDQNSADPRVIQLLEAHMRHVITNENSDMRYEVYKDLLSGGFSAIKLYTEYANDRSFQQVIKMKRVYDPTLCGFDQMAQESHKGDGRYCFELFPMSREDFEDQYPDVNTESVNFRANFAGFNWSYMAESREILMICDFYEKKKKKVKIVQTVDGRVMTKPEYDDMLEKWQHFTAPPAIVGRPRTSEFTTICRYRLIENQVIEYVETDYKHFPIIFVDGHSILIRNRKNGNIRQYTRPYVYHARDPQRLKNYAGISLANEIENTVQHKFMVAKEALPKEEIFQAAYKDVQKANVLVYNSLYEENPSTPIGNPIREVQRPEAPQAMSQMFVGADSLIQNVLGSYDASLGINDNQLSGIAIVEAASQSNATAMPYIVGFMHGLQRAAEVYVDLIPKYYTTPRTIPIRDAEGRRTFVQINSQGMPNMFYDSNVLNVVVKAGASFQVQKSRTLMMVKEMMGMSPLFAQFIATKGMNFVLDNMEGRGIEQLKMMVDQWQMELQQQQAQQQQLAQQQMAQNPAVMKNQIEMMRLQQDAKKDQSQFALDMAKLRADEQKLLADVQQSQSDDHVQMVKAETERFSHEIDAHIRMHELDHKKNMDIHDKILRLQGL